MKFVASLVAAVAVATSTSANPIRRVVDMLQAMQKKVEAEGEKEKDLMEKFMCYCKTNKGTLEESVRAAEAKAPQLIAAIDSATAAKQQMDDELVQHKTDRTEAKAAIEKATTLRNDEKAAFDKASSDLSTNLAAMNGAIKALEKGLGGFLQTSAAKVLSNLVDKFDGVLDVEEVRAFLQSGNAPAGGTAEIVGILKQMADQMNADLADANAKEEAAIKAFNGMVAAKNAEIEAATVAIEEKTARSGELAVEIVNLKNENADLLESLDEDRKFLQELNSSCSTKEAEWDERQKTRAEELLALSETIKVLNDDDALDLFNKASGMKKPAMLLQMDEAPKTLKMKALALIQEARSTHKSSALAMISMMLRGKGSFDQVTKMIDDLVDTLKQEQKDDEKHLDYCRTELDSAEDSSKDLARKHAELESQMETLKASIAEYADEISALTAGIQALDKSVADATEQRKKEHADYVETLANNNAAKQLIDFAKNRLNKFYNPKLYKAPKEREMTEEERVYVANGGTLAPEAAPGGIAGTGISGAFVQIKAHNPDCDCIGKEPDCGCSGKTATSFIQEKAAPAPPPETFDAYTKKGEESNGVIAMMDMLVKDLDTEIQEAEHDEKEGQKDYEEMMQTSADKRATDSKAITNAEGAKAESESNLESAKSAHSSNGQEILANNEYTANLHAECDFLMNNFELRKEARTAEVEGLKNAKAVLNGADYE